MGGGRWAWSASEAPLVRDTLGHLVVTASPREQLSSESTLPEGTGASLAPLKMSIDRAWGREDKTRQRTCCRQARLTGRNGQENRCRAGRP